jgi:hypothetical protein
MALILSGTNGLSDVDGSASTPAIRGTDTNTGIYFPGNDRIGFAEGGVQVGEFDASGNFQFNSGYGSTAIAYGCRAWVNFSGTGTVTIRASGNVTSITDNGTGDYTVNFTTALADANYCATFCGGAFTGGSGNTQNSLVNTYQFATTSFRFGAINTSGTNVDRDFIGVAIFR